MSAAPLDETSWLPPLVGPLNLQADDVAVTVPRRATVDLVGLSVIDDPTYTPTDGQPVGRTKIINSGSVASFGPTIHDTTSGARIVSVTTDVPPKKAGTVVVDSSSVVKNAISDGTDGREVNLYAKQDFTLKSADTGATAGERIFIPTNMVTGVSSGFNTMLVPAGRAVRLLYMSSYVVGGVGLWIVVGDALVTSKITTTPGTGELNHTGTPVHQETESRFFDPSDDPSGTPTYGSARSKVRAIQTTGATATTLFTVAVPAASFGDCVISIQVRATVCDHTGGGGTMSREMIFHRVSGTLTSFGTPTDTTIAANLTIATSLSHNIDDNDTISIKGTGIAATNITWAAAAHVQIARKT